MVGIGTFRFPGSYENKRFITRGEQALFNLEIKKKSGPSINPDIHHSKVPSSRTVAYIGLASNTFKERYLNHTSSFRNQRYKESTVFPSTFGS